MKSLALLLTYSLSAQLLPVLSQLLIPNILNKQAPSLRDRQHPTMNQPNIFLPPSDNKEEPTPSGNIMISDVIGKERVINIFAGFTRDIENIARRLDDKEQNTTVLAPLNSVLQQLPRKPWEDPQDYGAMGEKAYEGQGGEERAHRNLRRFVEAHVVPVNPWKEGEKVESLGGSTIWWKEKDGKKTIQPEDIEVSSIVSRVSNGEIWIIKGVMNNK
ncbi:hypothetical protein MMC13_006237 [Lambiella insularis]|nr:hypothetical protein [Lambiella insularis]